MGCRRFYGAGGGKGGEGAAREGEICHSWIVMITNCRASFLCKLQQKGAEAV